MPITRPTQVRPLLSHKIPLQGKARALLAEIHKLFETPSTNLIAKERELTRIREQIATLDNAEEQTDLEMSLTPLLADISDRRHELNAQKKWIAFGFPESVLSTHPDCVLFMVNSGFAYLLKMFGHSIRLSNTNDPLILLDGKYQPWDFIKAHVDQENFNYISPDGIVKKHRNPEKLYPIDSLDTQKQARLLAHANTFWQTHPEVDPGKAKPCVLQIVTTGDNILSPSWLTNGINDSSAKHTSIRLVDSQGKVYSFGIEFTEALEEYTRRNPWDYFVTGYGRLGTPDYRESRKFDERRVTSIPLTDERLQKILQFAGEINKGKGMRFSFSKQNCTKFGVMALALAGIDVDTRATAGEVLVNALPRLCELPILSWLCSSIKKIVQPILSNMSYFIPPPIKRAYSFATGVIFYIPNKCRTLFFNFTILYFGAAKEAEIAQDPLVNEPMNAHRIISFTSVITWWGDLFDDEKSDINHPYKLTQWQNLHASTILYTNNKQPCLQIYTS